MFSSIVRMYLCMCCLLAVDILTPFSSPQSVAEVQTATGCVVYGGYTVSSVLSDNDIVIAVSEHTSDDTSTPSV